jgi:RNA polymerase subunit RPABC4/transcription elongation factor Spt4
MKCNNIKCNNSADPKLGTGKYCSRSCSNARQHSAETKRKISEGVVRTGARNPPPTEKTLKKFRASISKHYEQLNASKPFEELGERSKRQLVFKEQGEKCPHCGLSEWRGEPITLELDHADGNRLNNARENLRLLCPNCHSLTKTWRGRNIENHKKIIPDSDVLALIEEGTLNPRQMLIKLGLVPKGGNYKRIYKLMIQNEQMKNQST